MYCVLIMMGIQDVCEVGEKVFSANLENCKVLDQEMMVLDFALESPSSNLYCCLLGELVTVYPNMESVAALPLWERVQRRNR